MIEAIQDYTFHLMSRRFLGNEVRWEFEASVSSRYMAAQVIKPVMSLGRHYEVHYGRGPSIGNQVWYFQQ